ncbi:hypothetical protein DM558_07630 [Entomomonas moraniae]|uniref:Terminase n=1 Tax=Entomomonas moraniae TaxID=2213226 RepID=A0A3Q9JJ24_9GAMM|nr:hypothetical protein [Entomomonas moraniae]AZS50656.1 hypothetical protein DM558_07630 [Entomomonas moraniae]
MIALQTKRELDRWYELKEHDVQRALVNAVSNGIRFPVVPAGRRSGKTERAKRFVAKMGMINPNEMYFIAAPTRDQVKKIYWQDMKKLCFSSLCTKAPSETELTIFLDNGTNIQLIGLDKPERIEGVFWSGGVIDEIADIKADAWEANIRPALDTFNPTRPDYKAWCWLIGVPDGLNHYYDMAQYAQSANDPEWGYFHWKSADILPVETIAAAKRQMSTRQYKQEYEADFIGATGRIYEDYSTGNHTRELIKPHEQLMWMHDQNFTPLSSAIAVKRDNCLYILDEIVLTSAVSKQSALEFVEKYKDHKNKHVLIYGDPAGKAGEKHGHASDYTDIEGVLKANGWTYTRKVKQAHPAIKDRQNAVRAKIKTADGHISLFVNPVTAKWCDKGLSTVQLQKGSTFQEDQTNQYQHITTAIGYCIDYEWPVISRKLTTQTIPGFGY